MSDTTNTKTDLNQETVTFSQDNSVPVFNLDIGETTSDDDECIGCFECLRILFFGDPKYQ
jgi:polyferredoxin